MRGLAIENRQRDRHHESACLQVSRFDHAVVKVHGTRGEDPSEAPGDYSFVNASP